MTGPGRRWTGLVGSVVLLAGCQAGSVGEATPKPSQPSQPSQPAQPSATSPPAVPVAPDLGGLDLSLTPGLPQSAPSLVRRADRSPPRARVDLDTILAAPTFTGGDGFSPIVAFGLNIFAPVQALPYDRIWLMARDGELRALDLAGLGVPEPDRGERAFALSPDRRTLAVADVDRILLVDLGSGSVRSLPVDAEEPTALIWVEDGESLWFVDRTVGGASLLDLATGAVATEPVGLIGWTPWAAGGLLGLESDREDSTTAVVVVDGGRSTTLGRLPIVTEQRAYPSCAAVCAFVERRPRVSGAPAARGLATFEPRSGRFGPTLEAVTSDSETLDITGWSDPGTLEASLAADGTTRVVRWQVETGEVRVLAELGVQGLVVSTQHG